MSNNEFKNRKLLHHQKPIWRKAFEASMSHTSIEGAERNAWKAVDVWDRVGAFNESQIERADGTGRDDYKDAFGWIREWLNEMSSDVILNGEKTLAVWEAVRAFDEGRSTIEQFKDSLNAIVPFVD